LVWRDTFEGRRAVFLVRYFLYAGSALLALLFLVNWYTPAVRTTAADQAQETSLDKEILRIRSAQKWPQKIDFDTNIPTIVPPPALAASIPPAPPPPLKAAEALNKPVLNAHAEARPVQAPPRRVAAAKRRTYNKPAPPHFGPYPVASAWSPWW
jgi:hypothetical protein